MYIQNPLRCHNCPKLGHHQEKCTNQPFTLTELQNSISKFNNSVPGPDEIHYTLLKELITISSRYIQYLDPWQHPYHIEANHNYPYPQKQKKSHKPYQL